jgi:hypothetical protein
MILDGNLTFTGQLLGNTSGIGVAGTWTDSVAQTTGTYATSNVVDLGVAGLPATTASTALGGARDIGVGDDPMLKLSIINTSAITSGSSSTIYFTLEGAPDTAGSSGTPGSWTVMWTSPTFTAATSFAAGQQLANVDVPRVIPGQPLPRFLRLRFVVGSATITGGAIEAQIIVDRDDQIIGTGGVYSGYVAGVTVAN